MEMAITVGHGCILYNIKKISNLFVFNISLKMFVWASVICFCVNCECK